jgi:hypothetical protein
MRIHLAREFVFGALTAKDVKKTKQKSPHSSTQSA